MPIQAGFDISPPLLTPQELQAWDRIMQTLLLLLLLLRALRAPRMVTTSVHRITAWKCKSGRKMPCSTFELNLLTYGALAVRTWGQAGSFRDSGNPRNPEDGHSENAHDIKILYGENPYLPLDGRYFRRFAINISSGSSVWKCALDDHLHDLASRYLGRNRIYGYIDECEPGLYDYKYDIDAARHAMYKGLPPPPWLGARFGYGEGDERAVPPDHQARAEAYNKNLQQRRMPQTRSLAQKQQRRQSLLHCSQTWPRLTPCVRLCSRSRS